jgi:hypothetical protein
MAHVVRHCGLPFGYRALVGDVSDADNGRLTTSSIASANAPGRDTVYCSRHIKQESAILIS